MHFTKLIIALQLLLAVSCSNNQQQADISTGDIFFCSYGSDGLSQAIDSVTQTNKGTHYSHMGLIEIENNDTFLIHAITVRGVVKETWQTFLKIENPEHVDIYKIKNISGQSRQTAIAKANSMIGHPYNRHYIMNDTCYYCSQLVYVAFETDQIFSLTPMTFKNINSEEYNTGWVNHYKSLHMQIPEGEPGCNPNGMASDADIYFYKRWQ